MSEEEIVKAVVNPETLAEYKGWEEEAVGFAPYLEVSWDKKEKIGTWFDATVLDFDAGSGAPGSFARFLLETHQPLTAKRGSKNRDEDVEVELQPGDSFTISNYAGLPLERFIGHRVLVRVIGTRPTNQPKPMYVFKVLVDPKTAALLKDERKRLAVEALNRLRAARIGQGAAPAKVLPEKSGVPFDQTA